MGFSGPKFTDGWKRDQSSEEDGDQCGWSGEEDWEECRQYAGDLYSVSYRDEVRHLTSHSQCYNSSLKVKCVVSPELPK